MFAPWLLFAGREVLRGAPFVGRLVLDEAMAVGISATEPGAEASRVESGTRSVVSSARAIELSGTGESVGGGSVAATVARGSATTTGGGRGPSRRSWPAMTRYPTPTT